MNITTDKNKTIRIALGKDVESDFILDILQNPAYSSLQSDSMVARGKKKCEGEEKTSETYDGFIWRDDDDFMQTKVPVTHQEFITLLALR